jgi:hypothetical protein
MFRPARTRSFNELMYCRILEVFRRKDPTYRMAKKSVNWKQSLVLTQMAKGAYARQYIQRYHRTATCALNMEDVISKFLLWSQYIINKYITYFSAHFSKRLINFRTTLYFLRETENHADWIRTTGQWQRLTSGTLRMNTTPITAEITSSVRCLLMLRVKQPLS